MKVYRARYQTEDGCFLVWAASKAEAEAKQREAVAYAEGRGYGAADAIRPVYVPDTKPALIAWLNSNLSADNG